MYLAEWLEARTQEDTGAGENGSAGRGRLDDRRTAGAVLPRQRNCHPHQGTSARRCIAARQDTSGNREHGYADEDDALEDIGARALEAE